MSTPLALPREALHDRELGCAVLVCVPDICRATLALSVQEPERAV